MAECSECNGQRKARAKEERERLKEVAAEYLRVENKMMESLGERSCAKCDAAKKAEAFNNEEKKKGKMSICNECIDKEIAEVEAAEVERKLQQLTRNARDENKLYKEKKDQHESYAKNSLENGSDIEKEMTTPSDVVYVITSVYYGGEPYTPKVHGIYTTCRKAQEGARRAFERVSTTYRDGEFLPNDGRQSKCDITEFLIPGVSFISRPLFEEFDDGHCAAIAINAVRIDTPVESDLPFISLKHSLYVGQKMEGGTVSMVEGTEVYAIFEFGPGHHMDYDEVNLCGVYRDREKAIERGKYFTNFSSLDDSDCSDYPYIKECQKSRDEQLIKAQVTTNGLLFNDPHEGKAVTLEKSTLDQDIKNASELDLAHMKFGYGSNTPEFY